MTETAPQLRTFKTLRVSLTNRCNLECTYCVTGTGRTGVQNQPITSREKTESLLGAIGKLHEILQLRTIRLTGGEPLLFLDLAYFVTGLKAMGLDDIRLTTNGVLLKPQLTSLAKAGINRINVSLDAINPLIFRELSRRRSIMQILQGIEEAVRIGLPLKINTVVVRGINDQEIIPLLQYAAGLKIQIRFLELMSMGHLYNDPGSQPKSFMNGRFYSQADILRNISTRHTFTAQPRRPSATANTWITREGQVFGIIANESAPFCTDCDRLRIDSEGRLFGCLSSNIPIQTAHEDSDALWNKKLMIAMSQKQTDKFNGSALSMLNIGG